MGNGKMMLGLIVGALAGAALSYFVVMKDGEGSGSSESVSSSSENTLEAVKERGYLQCGVSQGLPGFSSQDNKGSWSGIDVDYCRALAAAIFGDGSDEHVRFSPLSAKNRFTALTSKEIDVLSRNTTETFTRDNAIGLEFVGIMYYDGQGFMVPKNLGVTSIKELDGASVCVNSGTTTELNLSDYFRANGLKYELKAFESSNDVIKTYDRGECDAYTTDRSGVASERTKLSDPDAHIVLPGIISKEPLGPAIRQGDPLWGNLTRWVRNALVSAEELGITSKNVSSLKSSSNPEILRMLGVEKELGATLGVDNSWIQNILKEVGNYSEIYERNLGLNTPLKLERGVNALWNQGGILYSAPFR